MLAINVVLSALKYSATQPTFHNKHAFLDTFSFHLNKDKTLFLLEIGKHFYQIPKKF